MARTGGNRARAVRRVTDEETDELGMSAEFTRGLIL